MRTQVRTKPIIAAKSKPKPETDSVEPVVYTINQFCAAHAMSRGFYYNLRARNEGPAEIHVGDKVIITLEAAKRWRDAMEARTATERASA